MASFYNCTYPSGTVSPARSWLARRHSAGVLGVTRPALSALLNERAKLSPEMALRIEKVFGGSMDMLLRMQTSYDIAQTRKREGDIELVPFEEQVA